MPAVIIFNFEEKKYAVGTAKCSLLNECCSVVIRLKASFINPYIPNIPISKIKEQQKNKKTIQFNSSLFV